MHSPAAANTGRRCKGKGTENFWGLQKKFYLCHRKNKNQNEETLRFCRKTFRYN